MYLFEAERQRLEEATTLLPMFVIIEKNEKQGKKEPKRCIYHPNIIATETVSRLLALQPLLWNRWGEGRVSTVQIKRLSMVHRTLLCRFQT